MTKEELSQLYWLNKEVEVQQQRLKELECLVTSCTSNITGMPKGFNTVDKLANYVAEISDLKSQLEVNLKQCFNEIDKLHKYISSIEDSRARTILTLRYIKCLSWQEIADEIGYSREHLSRINKEITRCHFSL